MYHMSVMRNYGLKRVLMRKRYKEIVNSLRNEGFSYVVDDMFIMRCADTDIGQNREFNLVGISLGKNAWGYASIYGNKALLASPNKCIGKNISDLYTSYHELRVALLDAYCSKKMGLNHHVSSNLTGDSISKRQSIIKKVVNLCKKEAGTSNCVLMYGYFKYHIEALKREGLSTIFVDHNLTQVKSDITNSPKVLEDTSVAIVSASGLVDNVLFDTVSHLLQQNIKPIIIAQTAHLLIAQIFEGEDAILVCEDFPFWYLQGNSVLRIYNQPFQSD